MSFQLRSRLTFTVLLGCFALLILKSLWRHIVTTRARHKMSAQYNCKAPVSYPHRFLFFGLDAFRDAVKAARSRTYLQRIRLLYQLYGTTFSTRTLKSYTINTIESENIKAMLVTKFDDYNVGSTRRDAFLPLLGNYSIVMSDDAQWEHSRALLRSSFMRSQIEDLQTFEVHVRNLIEAIPRDESIVDLGDLFYRLTADLTTDFMFGESIESLVHPESYQADFMTAFRDAQFGGEERWRMGILAKVLP